MSTAIIYFCKLPIVGYNKTRLQGFLPVEDIQYLSVYLLKKNYQAIADTAVSHFVFVSPKEKAQQIRDFLPVKQEQVFGQIDHPHLGRRMGEAIRSVFEQGYDKVLLLGCDLIDITSDLLQEIIEKLDYEDVVIAPTLDGGYGVIASRTYCPQLFDLVSYSHDQVCQDTVSQAKQAGLSYALTRTIHDIDTREDVIRHLSGDPEAVYFNQGEYNANFLIDQGKKLLRIALASQMHLDRQIEYEYLALKGLAPSGVVPQVYEYVTETDLLGKGYLVEEYLPGRPLDYQTDLTIAAELLAAVHAVNPTEIPSLIVANQPFEVMYQEFLDMYSRYQSWEEKDREVEAKIDSLLAGLDRYQRDLPLENSCVINTELNSHNFLINPGHQSYIIDWEKPLVGEREQDLAHFLAPTTTLWKTQHLLSKDKILDFVKTYNQSSSQKVNLAKLKQYLHFTCLRGITWCAMAYVQYLEAEKVQANGKAFETISRFISIDFLEMIESYIDSLEDLF